MVLLNANNKHGTTWNGTKLVQFMTSIKYGLMAYKLPEEKLLLSLTGFIFGQKYICNLLLLKFDFSL